MKKKSSPAPSASSSPPPTQPKVFIHTYIITNLPTYPPTHLPIHQPTLPTQVAVEEELIEFTSIPSEASVPLDILLVRRFPELSRRAIRRVLAVGR